LQHCKTTRWLGKSAQVVLAQIRNPKNEVWNVLEKIWLCGGRRGKVAQSFESNKTPMADSSCNLAIFPGFDNGDLNARPS
jgi:hypothetical protein